MVVDTMLLVYAGLRIPGVSQDSRTAISACDEVRVPELAFAELAEALRRWIVAGACDATDAAGVIEDARAVAVDVAPVAPLVRRALELSVERRHPVYDAVFVALAERHGTRVVTYDRRMLAAFPERTISVPAFLATQG